MTPSQFPKSTTSEKRQASFTRVLEEVLSPDYDLVRIDLAELSNLSQAQLAQFQAVWQEISHERRQDLAAALQELSEDRFDITFNDIFRWMLQDHDARVRSLAIEGLWEDTSVRQITPLISLLRNDPAASVRAAAALSLGRFVLLGELEEIDAQAATRVEDALRLAYSDDEFDPTVRRRLLESLAYSGQDDIEEIILEAYQSDDPTLQVSAVFAMGRNASKRWRPFVMAELSSNDDAIRFEAVRASGELGMKSAVPDLIDLLGESDVELRELGHLGAGADRRPAGAAGIAGLRQKRR